MGLVSVLPCSGAAARIDTGPTQVPAAVAADQNTARAVSTGVIRRIHPHYPMPVWLGGKTRRNASTHPSNSAFDRINYLTQVGGITYKDA